MASSWYILALLFAAVAMTQCSLLDFGKMIKYVTGKNPLNYLLYGCYCGLGGFGHPKDKTDWCCHKHDCCYGYVEKTCPLDPKIKSYYYTIVDGNVLCDYQKNFDDCASLTCECDREAAYCFLKNLNTYDPNKKNASFSGCNKPTVPCS
uniref:Phospholipase A2 n=1 Tax=Leptobrachium leishanense TaxID=445787 RepID=A0A8C5WFC8_9ANUR